MKCKHKKELKQCKRFGTHTCANCETKILYCINHAGVHQIKTNHEIIECSGLEHFKKQIKTSISNIAQYASDTIAEISRTSLNSIIHLKQLNKIVNNNYELALKSYDDVRISFLIQQVSDIENKMNEILGETKEKLIIQKQGLADQIVNLIGTSQKCFNSMSLQDKKKHIKDNWNFISTDNLTQELLLSNDGKYIFHCKFQ